MKIQLISIFLIISLAGCTTSMQLTPTNTGKISQVDQKNYTKGVAQTVYVGEKIIARKLYKTFVQSNYVEATQNFTLSGGIGAVAISENGSQGDKYKIIGINEKGSLAVAIPGTHLAFGVTEFGLWDHTIASPSFWNSPVGGGVNYQLQPATTKFNKVESATPISDGEYDNHELIYTGIGSDGIHLLYREYTFENMARSAFSQELVYPTNSQYIRFKQYKIKVTKVSASELTYIVESE